MLRTLFDEDQRETICFIYNSTFLMSGLSLDATRGLINTRARHIRRFETGNDPNVYGCRVARPSRPRQLKFSRQPRI